MTELTDPTELITEVVENTEPTELVVLVQNSGLPEDKRPAIIQSLESFFKKAAEWDKTIATIVITSPEQVSEMKVAGATRKALKEMRLDADKLVKEKRNQVKNRMANDVLEDKLWLKSWQMIEAIYDNLESKCEEKEKFKERWDATEKEKRRVARVEQLTPFVDDVTIYNVGDLSEPAFNDLLEGSKFIYENKQKKAKEEQELADKLKKEAEEKQRTDKLAGERRLELMKFGYDYEADDLGKLEEIEYQKVFNSAKEAKEKADKVIKDEQEKQTKINTRLNQLLTLGMKYDANEKNYHGYNLRVTENHLGIMEEADWNNLIAGIEKGAKDAKDKQDKADLAFKENSDLNKLRLSQVTPYINYGPELSALDKLYEYSKKEWDVILTEKTQAHADELEKTRLQTERFVQLMPYSAHGVAIDSNNLWVYTPEKWSEIFEGKKAAYDRAQKDKIVQPEIKKVDVQTNVDDDRNDEQKLREMLSTFKLPEVKLSSPEGRGVYNEMEKKLEGWKKWCVNLVSENL